MNWAEGEKCFMRIPTYICLLQIGEHKIYLSVLITNR